MLQCVGGRAEIRMARLVLTASGGPFRAWRDDRIAAAR